MNRVAPFLCATSTKIAPKVLIFEVEILKLSKMKHKMSNSSEIKIKRRKNPFVQIHNSVFNDKRLSYKAKGILGYLLSKPDNWIVVIEDLYNHTTEGYSSINSGITELILTGYMELRTRFDENNQEFKGRKYVLREDPLFEDGFRKLENRNKNFKEEELSDLLEENPLGNKKVLKTRFS